MKDNCRSCNDGTLHCDNDFGQCPCSCHKEEARLTIKLSPEDTKTLVEALENPPEPNQRLKDAIAESRKAFEEGRTLKLDQAFPKADGPARVEGQQLAEKVADNKRLMLAKQAAEAQIRKLTEFVQAVATALAEPAGGEYWTARKLADKWGIYHDDLEGERVLLKLAEALLNGEVSQS